MDLNSQTLKRQARARQLDLELIRDLLADNQTTAAKRALDQLLTRSPDMQVPLDISAALQDAQ